MTRAKVAIHLFRERLLLAVAGMAVIGIAAFALVPRGHAGDPPPAGLAAGVSGLDRAGPVPGTPSRDMRLFAQYNAPSLGASEAQVMSKVRLLRANVGRQHRDVYGLRINGAVCFLLTGEGGTCSTVDGSSSFTWTIGGGDGTMNAGALVGIAADDVAKIDLDVDGSPIPVSLRNNVAYADLRLSGDRAQIVVHHADGRRTTDTVRLTG